MLHDITLYNVGIGIIIGLVVGFFILGLWIAYKRGLSYRERQVKQVYKKRDNGKAYDFIMKPGEDNAMEVILSKKQYKALRGEPLEGVLEGNKATMVFRIRIQ